MLTVLITFFSVLSSVLLFSWLWQQHRPGLLLSAIDHIPQAVIVTDKDSRIVNVNQAFTQITGYHSDEVKGKTPSVLSSGRQSQSFYKKMWFELIKHGQWQGELWNKRKNGEVYLESLNICAVYNPFAKVNYYVGTFTDISKNLEYEQTISRLAYYDSLTQLPNRQLLEDRLQKALKNSQANQTQGAVFFIDLDNFKTLNDTFGHTMGDLLLVEVAERIRNAIADHGTVSRWGGDEFVVLVEDLPINVQRAANQANALAEKIRADLAKVYLLNGLEYFGFCSIGVALFDQQPNVSELLKKADMAMYEAKGAGRNCIRQFDPQMQHALERKQVLENDLRRAIQDQQLHLVLQSQIRHGEELVGAEALLRWQHPDKGFISPAEFIPIAEQSDLIVEIGDWVLDHACGILALWQTLPSLQQATLSINVSERQMRQHDFVEKVLHAIERHQIRAEQLKLEITEGAVMQNLTDCAEKMERLRKYGIRFSMDDFGTGYSSLSNIRALPLSQLKIDRSFIQDMLEDESNLKLTQTIITMGWVLGLDIIAEGVEEKDQQHALRDIGCTQIQGYLFSKPLLPADFQHYALGFKHNENLNNDQPQRVTELF